VVLTRYIGLGASVLRADWLEERHQTVYPAHPGFDPNAPPLMTYEAGVPQELPDALRGEQWAFVMLPLSEVHNTHSLSLSHTHTLSLTHTHPHYRMHSHTHKHAVSLTHRCSRRRSGRWGVAALARF
jgi:hypothetical protein